MPVGYWGISFWGWKLVLVFALAEGEGLLGYLSIKDGTLWVDEICL